MEGHAIDFELLLDGKSIEHRAIEPQQVTDLLRIDMNCTPTEAGLHRITILREHRKSTTPSRSPASYRPPTTKSKCSTSIGRAIERAAISRALNAAEELQVIRTDLNLNNNGQSSALPRTADDWRRVRVILIGDIEAKAFPKQAMDAMAEAVRNGVGLAVIGGLRSLGREGYAGTPLRDLLPVDLSMAKQLSGQQKIELTPAGRSHPICQLANEPKANENIWKQIPSMEGCNLLGKPTPASEVLLQTPAGQPLFVVREAGPAAPPLSDSTRHGNGPSPMIEESKPKNASGDSSPSGSPTGIPTSG